IHTAVLRSRDFGPQRGHRCHTGLERPAGATGLAEPVGIHESGCVSDRSGAVQGGARERQDRRATQPLWTDQVTLVNKFWSLLMLDQVDEARAIIPQFKGGFALGAPLDVAAAAGQWAAAESVATVLQDNPSVDDDIRNKAAEFKAAAQA